MHARMPPRQGARPAVESTSTGEEPVPRSSGASPALGASSRGHRQRARTRQPPQRAQGCVRGGEVFHPTCATACTTTPMPGHGRGGAMQFTSHATPPSCAGQKQAPGRLGRRSRGFEHHQPVPGLLASGVIERAARRAGARIIRHHSGKEVRDGLHLRFNAMSAGVRGEGRLAGLARHLAAAWNPSRSVGSPRVRRQPHEQAAMAQPSSRPPSR